MAFSDWFSKAKAAKEKAKAPANNEYGNQGAGSAAYKEAQKALEEAEGTKEPKKGKEVADAD